MMRAPQSLHIVNTARAGSVDYIPQSEIDGMQREMFDIIMSVFGSACDERLAEGIDSLVKFEESATSIELGPAAQRGKFEALDKICRDRGWEPLDRKRFPSMELPVGGMERRVVHGGDSHGYRETLYARKLDPKLDAWLDQAEIDRYDSRRSGKSRKRASP